MSSAPRLRLFEAAGIELEYMIVDARTLDILPVCDALLRAASGALGDARFGNIGWSNELVLHVVELKTAEPAPSLDGLARQFQDNIARANTLLRPMGGVLMPSAMHPWMDPDREMRLWPHDCGEVYRAFDRIFGCRGHGWANLQSMHINLPFDGDEEFGRLHAAIRMVLPILPALAASSPVVGGRATGLLDTRLDAYRKNSARIPSVCGSVIPEPVYTRAGYERDILGRVYADMAPLDPDGVLRDEFANARGAIARFGRGSIEIRVLDAQECPAADIAIAEAIIAVLRAIVDGRIGDSADIASWPVEPLASILLDVIREGERAVVANMDYLRSLGCSSGPLPAGDLWIQLLEAAGHGQAVRRGPMATILSEGCLSRRILAALDGDCSRRRLHEVYSALAQCLRDGRMFGGLG